MDSPIPLPQAIWEHTPPEAQVYIRALESRVAALEAMVQPLREQVQQTSRTSSRPPSSDPPQALGKRPRHEPTGRRPGGQPGHEGQARALWPGEAVDVVIPVTPTRCRRCQHLLQGEDPQPQRHQVTEIPPVQPVVTEYQLHRLVCPACGEETHAPGPAGVPMGECGPRVQAITALCTGAYHLSKRTTPRALEDLCGVQMGLGTIANLEHATVPAVAEPVAEARADVQQPPVAYLEETGWREGQQRAWLWTAVTAGVTVFVVRLSRSAKVAQELLGERFWGWLVTARWSAYTWYPTWRRHVCWAHLRRDIEAMIDRGERSREIGAAVRAQARQMLQWGHRVRDGTLAPRTVARYMWPVRHEVERRLEVGQTGGVAKTESICRELLKRRQALWTFVRHEEVDPTNNAAEQPIRPGVLWRKGSFGTQSVQGSRVVEAMMTVAATLKQPHRNVLDYVTAACEAALCGERAPSRLPTPDTLDQGLRPAA
jgi:transposase